MISDQQFHRVYSYKGNQLVSLPRNGKSPASAVSFQDGFLFFEPERLDTGQTISRGYAFSLSTKDKTQLVVDAPVPKRISYTTQATVINQITFGLLDNGGGVWILGNVASLPSSVVSTPPGVQIKPAAP